MAHSNASFRLIPQDWRLKDALCGVTDASHTYFNVYTHIKNGEMATEQMVMMTKEDYDYLIKESKFWDKRNKSI
jgi:hypothetical protein